MIEGDGIGPEIAQSVKDIFAAAKVRVYGVWSFNADHVTGAHQMGVCRRNSSIEG